MMLSFLLLLPLLVLLPPSTTSVVNGLANFLFGGVKYIPPLLS